MCKNCRRLSRISGVLSWVSPDCWAYSVLLIICIPWNTMMHQHILPLPLVLVLFSGHYRKATSGAKQWITKKISNFECKSLDYYFDDSCWCDDIYQVKDTDSESFGSVMCRKFSFTLNMFSEKRILDPSNIYSGPILWK